MTEILGRHIALIGGIASQYLDEGLKKFIAGIDPERWYSIDAIFDIENALKTHGPEILKGVGRTTIFNIEKFFRSQGIDSPAKALSAIDRTYKQNLRGDDLGAYDYGSIMHYPRDAFSRNGRDTITPTDPSAVIGQRRGLSAGDIAAVRDMYNCGEDIQWLEAVLNVMMS